MKSEIQCKKSSKYNNIVLRIREELQIESVVKFVRGRQPSWEIYEQGDIEQTYNWEARMRKTRGRGRPKETKNKTIETNKRIT